ncbi:hypothetical protein CY34DRAFT_12716 [Suillus luteus UH-Slu-Lm8-n1]|uniref:Uncharacterized protein n=1 Tax=Suillus luteus UH-Slu-Lm8-n1 TaxID=930992 RepID=A0A0D0B649_9AGAM|nr:hypothetical protein CY34DRAFT_12716 [Suillus luteus UH-Slu-Lm8-n1]
MAYRLFSVAEPDVEKYKVLRLTSLKVDPASFSSTYESEITFTPEIWVQRLASYFEGTFIASVKVEGSISETLVGMRPILGPSELIPVTLEPFERVGSSRSRLGCVFRGWAMGAPRAQGKRSRDMPSERERRAGRGTDKYGSEK